MRIGYARTSTLDQSAGLEAQLKALSEAGVEKTYQEQTSAVGGRPQLDAAIEFSRQGDTLVVTKLDRLARSVGHLGKLTERLEDKGVSLKILDLGLDSSTATGRLMLNLIGSIAQFEREMMLERQREGIAKAKAEGKYKGRKPTAREKTDQVRELLSSGKSKRAIAAELGISEMIR